MRGAGYDMGMVSYNSWLSRRMGDDSQDSSMAPGAHDHIDRASKNGLH